LNACELSRLLIDEYSAKILTYAKNRPRSVQDMCQQLNIPTTLGYRRVNILVSMGLLSCEGKALTRAGKWTRLYLSQVRRAFIFFDGGRVRLKCELNTGQIKSSDDWAASSSAF
jgi:hypothetical protein